MSFHEDAKKQLADNDRGSYFSQDIQWPSEYLKNEKPKQKDVGASTKKLTKSSGQDAAGECQYKSFNDEETQVGVIELEASQLTVIDPDLLDWENELDAAVCKKSGFGLKLLENHR